MANRLISYTGNVLTALCAESRNDVFY